MEKMGEMTGQFYQQQTDVGLRLAKLEARLEVMNGERRLALLEGQLSSVERQMTRLIESVSGLEGALRRDFEDWTRESVRRHESRDHQISDVDKRVKRIERLVWLANGAVVALGTNTDALWRALSKLLGA